LFQVNRDKMKLLMILLCKQGQHWADATDAAALDLMPWCLGWLFHFCLFTRYSLHSRNQ